MNATEALRIMNLHNENIINREIIKQSYRRLSSKYHPDRNPNGLKMMQDLNIANDYLKDIPDNELNTINKNNSSNSYKEHTYRHQDPEYFYEIIDLGLEIYKNKKDGKIWVYGKTYEHKEILKYYGFRWNPDERAWWKYA